MVKNSQVEAVDTLIGEFHFFGLSNGTTTINSVNNSTVTNSIKTPVGMYGAGSAANEPTFYPNGVKITHNKYLVATAPFSDTNIYQHKYQMWIYYIKGQIGSFMNVDSAYATTYKSSVHLYTSMSGTSQMVNFSFLGLASPIQIPQALAQGWNSIVVIHD